MRIINIEKKKMIQIAIKISMMMIMNNIIIEVMMKMKKKKMMIRCKMIIIKRV